MQKQEHKMAGRPMTNSLAFVRFLPVDGVSPDLQDLAEEETALVESLEKTQEQIKAVREKAKDLLLDVTPRQIAKAKADLAAEQKADEDARKEAQASHAQ
jgi:hypothetical protein